MKSLQNFVNGDNVTEAVEKPKKIKNFPWFEVFHISPSQTRSERIDAYAWNPTGHRGDAPHRSNIERMRYANFDDALQDCKDGIKIQRDSFDKENTFIIVEQTAKDRHRVVWIMTDGKETDLRK